MSEQRKIVEDSPQMRSVALHSAVPMMPRMAPLARPKQAAAVESATKEQPAVGSSRLWTVASAPKLPSMFFLERTHVSVAQTSAQTIANRIVECLRSQSVAARYSDTEALVEAETQECVQLAIRLWEKNEEVIAEVQRVSGCSFSFHQLAKSVLRSAQGIKARPSSPKLLPLPKCCPQESEEERKQCLKEGLQIAVSLLQKESVDSQLMAMESLVHLTKVCKKGFAAESILEDADLRTLLIATMVESTPATATAYEASNLCIMRRHAMTVLANCLDALKENGKLQACLEQHDSLRSQSLLDALLVQVAKAALEPHHACQAVRCLACLTEASSDIRSRALARGMPAVLSQAHETGACRHVYLHELTTSMQL